MKETVKLSIHGIKCDNPKCDYEDMSVQYEDYPNWLNRPCPKCGANLLTNKDFKTVKVLVEAERIVNKFFGKNKESKDESRVSMTLDLHGTGDVEVTDIHEIKAEEGEKQ